MQRNLTLTIASFLSILFLTFHLTQDALHAPVESWAAGPGNFTVIAVLSILLWGTVMLAGRRSGFVIQLLTGLIALGMPILHLKSHGVSPDPRPGGIFLFMWTMIVLGILGIFTAMLAARALWNTRRRTTIGEQTES
jgi:hypothetical protein